MMKKRGFTLTEIIIALALIGLIAASSIPLITSQIVNFSKAREIPRKSFQTQDQIEKTLFSIRRELPNVNTLTDLQNLASSRGDGVETISFFGKNITLYKSKVNFPMMPEKEAYVFLSTQLAKAERRIGLMVENVRLEVKDKGPSVHIAKLEENPTLKGVFSDLSSDPTWYANIYTWYYSRPGVSEPVWPQDYQKESHSVIGKDKSELNPLNKYVNRYMIFSVIPVDIHGVRGAEIASTNNVYIQGPEWRGTTFAYVDVNDNMIFDETDAIKDIKIIRNLLTSPFDSSLPIQDLVDPTKQHNPANKDVYVPSKIDAGPSDYTELVIDGEEELKWTLDKSIHIAADINVKNRKNMVIETRDGDISLYRYVKWDSYGKPIINGGIPELIDRGVSIQNEGNILLKTQGAGNLAAEFPKMRARNIYLEPRGSVYMDSVDLSAVESIVIDTAKNPELASNRNVTLSGKNKQSSIQFNGAPGPVRFTIQSTGRIGIDNLLVKGNSKDTDFMELKSTSSSEIRNLIFNEINLMLRSKASMSGGGWSEGSILVEDNNLLTMKAEDGLIANEGSINLSEKGRIVFQDPMNTVLKHPLEMELIPEGDAFRLAMKKYIRKYNLPVTELMQEVSGTPIALGSEDSGLMYTAEVSSGSVSDLKISYQVVANDKIQFIAEGKGSGSAELTIKLWDKYTHDIQSNEVQVEVQMTPAAP